MKWFRSADVQLTLGRKFKPISVEYNMYKLNLNNVTSLHDVMHSYAILDYIINLVNEMKFIHLYLFNYVNIDGN